MISDIQYTEPKRYAPAVPSMSKHRPFDTDYLRELLRVAGLTQRAAGPMLDMSERSMRDKASGKVALSYPEQYMLEVLADSKQQGDIDMLAEAREAVLSKSRIGTVWTHTGERRITSQDAGKMLVGYTRFREPVNGILVRDGFGLVVKSQDGLDVHNVPIDKVTSYTLIDPFIPLGA